MPFCSLLKHCMHLTAQTPCRPNKHPDTKKKDNGKLFTERGFCCSNFLWLSCSLLFYCIFLQILTVLFFFSVFSKYSLSTFGLCEERGRDKKKKICILTKHLRWFVKHYFVALILSGKNTISSTGDYAGRDPCLYKFRRRIDLWNHL